MKRVSTATPQEWLYEVIFEHDTWEGRAFDLVLLLAISGSVSVVILSSVKNVHAVYGGVLGVAEWFFTGLFTVEYLLRIYAARRRLRYVLSFFGLVDLIALLPTYVSLLLPGAQYLLVVRILRVLRVFRVLKMTRYRAEAELLRAAVAASTPKVVVFLGTVLTAVVITGAAMHLVEGPEHGFDDIPRSMYWAVVTMTTVGYGDIAPGTTLGRGIASFIMVLGYGIIAVPTGIVSAEMVRHERTRKGHPTTCSGCGLGEHQADALHCRGCGAPLS